MRTSIVAVFALAALCMGVTAFPRSLSKLTAKASARRTQNVACSDAVQQLKQCAANYATEEAALANCCSYVNGLYGTCGADLSSAISGILWESYGDIDKVRFALTAVSSCSAPGNPFATGSGWMCESARGNLETACAVTGSNTGYPGGNSGGNPMCCSALSNTILSCTGVQSVMTDDAFWDKILAYSELTPNCQIVFSPDACTAAVVARSNCINQRSQVFGPSPVAGMPAPYLYTNTYVGYKRCCEAHDWYRLFCAGQITSELPGVTAEINSVCNAQVTEECDFGRIAHGFHLYTEQVTDPVTGLPSPVSRIVTSRWMYAVGGFGGDPFMMPTSAPLFTGASGVSFYEVDWSRLPAELQAKLHPRDSTCPAIPSARAFSPFI